MNVCATMHYKDFFLHSGTVRKLNGFCGVVCTHMCNCTCTHIHINNYTDIHTHAYTDTHRHPYTTEK